MLANREAGLALREQAVLFRTATTAARSSSSWRRRNIPFVKFGGLKFLEAAHVKDLLAILRWAENPRDRMAAFRVLQLLPGIGPGTARKALALLERARPTSRRSASFAPPAAAAELWPALVDADARACRAHHLGGPARAACAPSTTRCSRSCYELRPRPRRPISTSSSGSPRPIRRASGSSPSSPSIRRRRAGDEAGAPLRDEDYLILSTIHSAKGQEWRAVYVLNVVDGCIPSDMATGTADEIEEERRLLYVAMTRARDQLHLIHPQRFYVDGQPAHGDRYVHAPRSRFIPRALLARFEVQSARPGAALAGQRGQSERQARRYRREAACDVALSALAPLPAGESRSSALGDADTIVT